LDTINLYGDIGSSYWFDGIGAKDVVLALKELDTSLSKHYCRINSPGGFVDEGLAIMNVLMAHKNAMRAFNPDFQLETVVDGYAMSAATMPLMAGDIRTLALGGVVMIHDAWTWANGNAADLRKQADQLDKLSQNIADVYAARCVPAPEGKAARSADYFRQLMAAESYLMGQETKDCGLITNIDESSAAALLADLTPEKMKGHYAAFMTTKRTHTFSVARSKDSLLQTKQSLAALDALAAELGTERTKA
jgi:ATP-dependent Clp protease protease subunit